MAVERVRERVSGDVSWIEGGGFVRAVVVYRTDGLGSRLIAFGNGLRLARALEVPCYLSWNDPHEVGGLSDLGELLDLRQMPPTVKVVRHAEALLELLPRRICYAGIEAVIDREALSGADVLLCNLGHLQRFSDEAPSAQLNADLARALRGLVPAPELADRIRSFSASHDVRGAVGVHVRRGDLIGHRDEKERRRMVGLDRYFAVLDAVAASEPLFLCSDDLSVVGAFQERYPDRVLRYPTTSWARNDRESTSDALIEMFLLSATQFIVAGPSGFSRFAAAKRARPLVVLRNVHSLEQSLAMAYAAARVARASRAPENGAARPLESA